MELLARRVAPLAILAGDSHDPGWLRPRCFPGHRVSRDLKEEHYHAVP